MTHLFLIFCGDRQVNTRDQTKVPESQTVCRRHCGLWQEQGAGGEKKVS